jgi:hypothetical protein
LYSSLQDESDAQVKDEMGGACGTYEGEEKCTDGSGGKTSRGKKNLFEDLGIDNRVILKWISNRKDARGWTGDLAHDRNT